MAGYCVSPCLLGKRADLFGNAQCRGVACTLFAGVLIPGDEPPAEQVVIHRVVIDDISHIILLEVSKPRVRSVKIDGVTGAAIHHEIVPQVVRLGIISYINVSCTDIIV